ncbi:WD-repeat protein [Reticulomyxa filosa]|uniref:WD-repeat protein n=1 Tax=Reticulomyxa filosa TaxID=46433 RepID=X6M465_RETFI|nr:WD-repeat protein [Reticulomyxa filosa]|eukprot:ETO08788.1 WD-repeat protein [Reticulomyxa filosa]
MNTILSGSNDKSVRLCDIRSGEQIQVFNGHTNTIWAVEYSPFVIKNSSGNSNVICSGSLDNTIRFWDIRSNKNELFMIKGDDREDCGILCIKFIELKKKEKTKNITYDLNFNLVLNLFGLILLGCLKNLKKLHSMFLKRIEKHN